MLRTRVARGIANAKRTLRLRDIAPQSLLRFAPAGAHQKISFHFLAAPPTPPAARRKEERKGNFWSATALQKLRKEQLLKTRDALFSVPRAVRGAFNSVCATAQSSLYVLAPPAQCAHRPARRF